MKLLSNYIMIDNPFAVKDEKSIIHLNDAVKEEMLEAKMLECKRLKVHAVGIDAKVIKEGDEVMPNVDRLVSAYRTSLGDKAYLLLRENDFILVY